MENKIEIRLVYFFYCITKNKIKKKIKKNSSLTVGRGNNDEPISSDSNQINLSNLSSQEKKI